MVDSTNLPDVDINQIATDLNGKMDRDGVNASCPVVISRTPNNQGGIVEIWSDGYCVQTGIYTPSTPSLVDSVVTLPYSYTSTNYNLQLTQVANRSLVKDAETVGTIFSNSTFGCAVWGNTGVAIQWEAKGYIR